MERCRMMLWKAGTEFNEESFAGFKEWGEYEEKAKITEFGQLPSIVLVDGTVISNANTIFNYIGETCELMPEDPVVKARGDSFHLHTYSDVWVPNFMPIFMSNPDDRSE